MFQLEPTHIWFKHTGFWNRFQKHMVMHGSPFSMFQLEPNNDTSNSPKGNLFIV